MPETDSTIIKQLASILPGIHFVHNENFSWSPGIKTVFHRPILHQEDAWLLLHEAGHASLDHQDYSNDMTLLHYERDAWEYAQHTLNHAIDSANIPDEFIENHLDTYREWLFTRSRCPTCHLTGVQIREHTYSCLNCRQHWEVNEARYCSLRRYKISGKAI